MAEGAAAMSGISPGSDIALLRPLRWKIAPRKMCNIFSRNEPESHCIRLCSFFYENLISLTHFSSSSPLPVPSPSFPSKKVLLCLIFYSFPVEIVLSSAQEHLTVGSENTLSSSKSRWLGDIFCSLHESTRFIFYYHFLPPRFGNIQMKFSSASLFPQIRCFRYSFLLLLAAASINV